jgi:hypothetical protein
VSEENMWKTGKDNALQGPQDEIVASRPSQTIHEKKHAIKCIAPNIGGAHQNRIALKTANFDMLMTTRVHRCPLSYLES